MKDFAALMLDKFWSDFVIRWKKGLMEHPLARQHGFADEEYIEETIAGFIEAVEEERKHTNIKRVAWDIMNPWLVTFNGTEWHPVRAVPGIDAKPVLLN